MGLWYPRVRVHGGGAMAETDEISHLDPEIVGGREDTLEITLVFEASKLAPVTHFGKQVHI